MDIKKILVLFVVIAVAAFMACGSEEVQADPQVEETVETADVTETADTINPEMTEEEMIAYVMENCICPECPSWIPEATELGEGGYCAVGVSECIVDEVGCICADCPVTLEKGLMWGYYCTRGSAAEMMDQ